MGTLFIVILALGGTACMLRGLRLRNVGDHPTCQQCGYNLTGRAPQSTRCPECGSDLSVPASIAIGRPRPNGRLIIIGFLALLLIYPTLLLQSHWQQIKPVWLLRMDLDGGTAAQIDALHELQGRLIAKQLTDAQIAAIADRCLEVQANLAIPWQPEWGKFIEAAQSAGRLDPPRWVTYARQSMVPELLTRPIIRQGDPVPINLDLQSTRRDAVDFLAYYDWDALQCDGKSFLGPIRLPTNSTGDHVHCGGLSPGILFTSAMPRDPGQAVPRSLPPGPHELEADLHIYLYKRSDTYFGNAEPASTSRRLAQYELKLTCPLTVVVAAPPLVASDPAQRAAVIAALQLPYVCVDSHDRSHPIHAAVALTQSTPYRLVFRVFVRPAGGTSSQEIDLGPASCSAGHSRTLIFFDLPGAGSLGGARKADLIFRPDMSAIPNSIDPTPAWGEEIILPNLPVTYK